MSNLMHPLTMQGCSIRVDITTFGGELYVKSQNYGDHYKIYTYFG